VIVACSVSTSPSMTIKLYWDDSHLTRFDARVVEAFERDGNQVVVLDQTAFYPVGGGQPADSGQIAGMDVRDVELLDDGRILHHLSGQSELEVDQRVGCEVDWGRRREITQQHTGQHILSQAFFQLFGAETRGFRINDRVVEIDLTLEAPADEVPAAIERAEDLANSVVFDDRQIRTHTVTPEEATRLPLRKESFVTDCVRVIEIEDFDWSPCGGTHAKRTGEVGLIAVRGWERAKKMVRVEFLCGQRALRDYRAANATGEAVARRFSVLRDDADVSVARLLDDYKALGRRVKQLSELAARAEARELIDGTIPDKGRRTIGRIFESRDVEELKLLAHRLTDCDSTVALLATRDAETARLVFARSADLKADMNELMRRCCERLGGRGGGKPDFAQGGGPRVVELEAAIAAAVQEIS